MVKLLIVRLKSIKTVFEVELLMKYKTKNWNTIKNFLRKSYFYKEQAIKNNVIMSFSNIEKLINEAPVLLLDESINIKPNIGIVKTESSSLIAGYENPKASWMKYERFCKINNIPYSFYDIKESDWIEKSRQYDIIICHTEGSPAYQEMIESKIYILDKLLKISCFPSFHEVWQYEDKVRSNYLYQCKKLPTIPTFVTHSKNEALQQAEKSSYPFITKTTIGSGSSGVIKVDTKKQAKKLIHKIFSDKGVATPYAYQNQKDYFYFQEFIDDATFDLRIILIDDMAFGYYRYPQKGDFRASGAGIFLKKDIPSDALKVAINVRDKLQSRQLGIDLLYSEKYGQYLIIETSLFNQIDSPSQLEVDGVAGYYDISDINNINFKEGKYWVQELVLKNLISNWVKVNQSGRVNL